MSEQTICYNDVAGNALDGEANLDQPEQNRSFPSGDGVPGGNFVARFAVDSRPVVDTWSQGVAYAEINGKFVWDPQGNDNDSTNDDFVFNFGEDHRRLLCRQLFTARRGSQRVR